jgi:hypothetical protein
LVIDLFKNVGYVNGAAVLQASVLCIVHPIPSPHGRHRASLPGRAVSFITTKARGKRTGLGLRISGWRIRAPT